MIDTPDTPDTDTEAEAPAPPLPPVGSTPQYAWETDDSYAERITGERDARDELVASLAAAMALVIDADLVVPSVSTGYMGEVRLAWHTSDAATFDAIRAALGSTLASPWEKHSDYGNLHVTRQLVPGVKASVYASWGTCEKVEVGTTTEDVEVEVCPDCTGDLITADDGVVTCATDLCAYERRPAAKVTRQVAVPITEWRCPEVTNL